VVQPVPGALLRPRRGRDRLSGVVVVTATLTRVYKLDEFFPPRMFKGLGIFLGFILLLYMYFLSPSS